ncbi:hypothetical protein PN836_016645 [Ningiella sp. W23]|uniref:hypothetical protein n=1 Tax=Ningiella sp. W23 TaxID=3023715 RepID=UPI003756B2BA
MSLDVAKTAVIYHYYEKNLVYKDNFVFFLSLAWRVELDFFIIIAGDTTIKLPQHDNIRYFFTENLQHDFAGYSLVVDDEGFNIYSHFIFLNCTVRGPFLPPYVNQCWTQPFVSLLKDSVHLSGASINILHEDRPFSQLYEAAYPNEEKPFSHVQSSVLAMTNNCFHLLLSSGFFDKARGISKEDAIVECEIRMSQLVKQAGWNISCVLPPYQEIDYRLPHSDINKTTNTGHPQSVNAYFGNTLHPFEVIFLKTGWGALTEHAWNFYSVNSLKLKNDTIRLWDADEYQELLQRLQAYLETD